MYHLVRKPWLTKLVCTVGVALVSLGGACSRAQETAPIKDGPAALMDYIARPEPAFVWQKAEVPAESVAPASNLALLALAASDVEIRDMQVTSQTWQGQPWKHRVRVFRPAKPQFPDLALVFVQGGTGASDTVVGRIVAHFSGATVVHLTGIPNQPLYGRNEDALIAYTFGQYLTTGDATWPLLLPMTKSVVKTMDAVGDFSQREGWTPITRYIVTGASKRGWTTWLTAAVDKRVVGIAPLVYDNLNLERQMKHQIDSWGAYSEQIADYTRAGLIQQLTENPKGKQLSAIVDPWTYRDRITVPKLIINGSNDPYWTLDSLSLYRSELRGPTNVLYAPNAVHSLGGQETRVLSTIAAWVRRVGANRPVPQVSVKASDSASGKTFTLTTDATAPTDTPREARLWVARSATRDFRKARWESIAMEKKGDGNAWTAIVLKPAADIPWTAAFGEVDIYGDLPESLPPMRLSSDVTLWK